MKSSPVSVLVNKLSLINQATTDCIVVAPFMEQNFEIPYDKLSFIFNYSQGEY